MKKLLILIVFASIKLHAQTSDAISIFDGRSWGVVLQHPEMKNVTVKKDVVYLSDSKGTLTLDVYLPPSIKIGEKRPTIIFLNAIGDQPGQMKVKSWGIYSSWPQLIAANGYVGISMECDGSRIQESLKGVFHFLEKSGAQHHVDADKLGVYAASANVSPSAVYLMSNEVYKGIKAAVLYYGGVPSGPYRKDLPVYFVVAEGDVARTNYNSLWTEVLKNHAPWTIQMGSNLIHAFDAFSDNDDSRKVVKETISFWKNHLDPIPPHSWRNAIGREVLAAQYGNNNKQATSLLRAWITEHPDDSNALVTYSGALRRSGEYAEAEIVLEKCLRTNPENIGLLSDLMLTEYALNKSAEGEVCLKKITQSTQINSFQLANLGMSLYMLGKHRAGVSLFEKSVELQPNGVNYYNLACGYTLVQEKEKAFGALQKAIHYGFTSRHQFENDSDLASLKDDDRFKLMLEKLK